MSAREEELVGEDVIHHIAGFLAPRDLFAASRVNTYWQEICSSDAIWRQLCVSRWLLRRPESIKRSAGTEGFMELYMYLSRNRFLPQGKYTSKQQVVWGKGRQELADAWVTVVHTPDCRAPMHRGSAYIQLRVAVQNLDTRTMVVDLQDVQVRFKNGDPGRILGVSKAGDGIAGQVLSSPLAPSLVAVNGVDVLPAASRRAVELSMFDIAVISINVECPDCEFETDFLESCGAIWIPIRRMGKCVSLARCRCGLIPDSYHHGSIRVPIVDESAIWKYYTLISGRFMVFDNRSAQDLLLFDSPTLKANSPTKARRKRSIS